MNKQARIIMRDKVKGIIKSTGLHIILGKLKFSFSKGKLRQTLHFATKGHLFRKYRIKKYVFAKRNTFKKLQIGGGYHTKHNWINGDLIAGEIYLNAARKFPFSNGSIDIIFAEQFIEHLSFGDGSKFLKECRRVLKKGGKIRLSTPDLKLLISTYEGRNPNVSLGRAMERHKNNHNKGLTTACHFLNDYFRLWGHSFIYDEDTLTLQLKNIGFSNITRQEFGYSEDKNLSGLERHADFEWMKDAWTLILEGEKISD